MELVLLVVSIALSSAQKSRCGVDWESANARCGDWCARNTDCNTRGEMCYAALDVAPCEGTRCGAGWEEANLRCSGYCKGDGDCADGEGCYADLDTSPCRALPPPGAPTDLPPPASSGCGSTKVLTLGDLQAIMKSTHPDLANWVTPINIALDRYQMNCPKRLINFLAQVRHETAGLTVFHQPLDNGAGVLHMTPSNWPLACSSVSEIAEAFGEAFPGCQDCSCTQDLAKTPMSADATKAALSVFSKPLPAALSGAWWYAAGAQNPQVFGWKGCGDLRLDADAGLGAPGPSDCTHSGLYQTTCCIFWTIGDGSGLSQRLQYYNEALQVANSWGLGLITRVFIVGLGFRGVDGF
eukprot:TRINITY_DN2979_c0_g1_i1.p1 TRINITY_DN2979_c0_g1~~TRINITY_DN2979_c0_g1_i1.p1  ORF type:complete len:353 (+),score=51.42 TRINITY_DN2979_c0_g1_i1:22-1080(+)